jgi:uncharacterized protein YvpB
MSESERRRIAARRRSVLRRRRIAAVVGALAIAGLVALLLGAAGGSRTQDRSPRYVTVRLGRRVLAKKPVSSLRRPGAIPALLDAAPSSRVVHRGPTVVHLRTERAALYRELSKAARGGGGSVSVPERATAAWTRVPLVPQALRDNCETASLSMILAFRGRPVSQIALQSQVAHSEPLDPTVGPDGSEVWGDPSSGFVGRADGGGPAGGFGVYERPIEALARRHAVKLHDLTGASPQALYRALLTGHPVLAWVALSEGPFATWETPSGRTVRVNYGEHAIVLTGVGPRTVRLNDPLSGHRLIWQKPEFERMWAGLGHRALSA